MHKFVRIGGRWRPAAIAVVLLAASAGCGSDAKPPSASQQSFVTAASANGATSIEATQTQDGGLLLGGELDGHQFALVIPAQWNRQALLFAHGYSVPGSPVAVPENPVATDPAGGLLTLAYSQGYAVGHSAYAKAGMGVETAATNTLRLKTLVEQIGTEKIYVAGASMGGNIVMALIENHPGEFAGALAACGVTDSWQSEIGALMDMRAAYNYFTADTDYALPGERSIAVSALSPDLPALLAFANTPFRLMQMKRIANPVLALFEAAQAQPGGAEDRMIRRIASLTRFEPEVASFIAPLLTVSLGMDDLNATFGGLIHDNSAKVYHSALLSDEENAELNRRIERVQAAPTALAYADRWHRITGRFDTKLVAIHNQIDSLVPYAQYEGLIQRVREAQNDTNLLPFTVPTMQTPIPGSDMQGLAHCGFTPDQIATAWNGLVRWTADGQRPELSAATGN